LVFVIVRWVFIFREGQYEIVVAPLLYALLLWRLWIARKEEAATRQTVVVDAAG
jgi:hypothetical protein